MTEVGSALLNPQTIAAITGSTQESVLSLTSNFMKATINSLFMILVTEIGDKTFFIAAVLAMRNARIVVYAGAMGALVVMHLLSAMMGFALPNLIPRAYTHFASAVLFVYFGIKLLRDSAEMSADGPSEELQEVEEELVKKKGEVENADDEEVVGGADVENNLRKSSHSKKKSKWMGIDNLQVFTQAFTLTFLAEWGDRSQIATIALASHQHVYGVIIGGLVGHAFCTGMAVVGGRMLAARISEKTVAIIGGVLFLFFAATSFLYGPDSDGASTSIPTNVVI